MFTFFYLSKIICGIKNIQYVKILTFVSFILLTHPSDRVASSLLEFITNTGCIERD